MQSFRHRWSRFEFRRPRHPLLRLGVALLGVALLALLLVFGLFVGLAMLAFTAVRRVARALSGAAAPAGHRVQPDASGDVIEGEYDVVRKPHDFLPR
jgi:uncharacterized membrane protein YjgN (DUF898 family)